jgi:hypothetical protein
MDKASNQLGVNPLAKISALSAVASLGNPAQALASRAENLAKQQAGLLAKSTVLDLESLPKNAVSTSTVSDAALLINKLLKQAEASGIANQYIAKDVVSSTPQRPDLVAQQLKVAITNTGLFYESHLKDFVEGTRQLNAIRQEPQSQLHQVAQSLLPQQLHILENQRLSWHGEVWPNQQMDWDIYLQNKQEEENKQYAHEEVGNAIGSSLTLNLPRLGKVVAKINIVNGQMQVGISAEEQASLSILKEKSPLLANAIESHGQRLSHLTVTKNE